MLTWKDLPATFHRFREVSDEQKKYQERLDSGHVEDESLTRRLDAEYDWLYAQIADLICPYLRQSETIYGIVVDGWVLITADSSNDWAYIGDKFINVIELNKGE